MTGAVAAQDRFEGGVFAELNRFRSDPAAYTEYLSDYRPRFEGKLLIGSDDGEIDIMTREGVAAVDEAIRDLRREGPLPTLAWRSEEHTSELQSLMRISYAVFCLKKKKRTARRKPQNS